LVVWQKRFAVFRQLVMYFMVDCAIMAEKWIWYFNCLMLFRKQKLKKLKTLSHENIELDTQP
jgi:hypothetical protein